MLIKNMLSVSCVKKNAKTSGKEYFLFSSVDETLGAIEDFLPVELVSKFKTMEKQNYHYEVVKQNNRIALKLVDIQ